MHGQPMQPQQCGRQPALCMHVQPDEHQQPVYMQPCLILRGLTWDRKTLSSMIIFSIFVYHPQIYDRQILYPELLVMREDLSIRA
jgi:hypothetical protein